MSDESDNQNKPDVTPVKLSNVVDFKAAREKKVAAATKPAEPSEFDEYIGLQTINGLTIIGKLLRAYPDDIDYNYDRLGPNGFFVLESCIQLSITNVDNVYNYVISPFMPFNSNDFNIFRDDHILSTFMPALNLCMAYDTFLKENGG